MQLDLFTDSDQSLSFGKTCRESSQPQTTLLDASSVAWLAQSFRSEPQRDDSHVQVWLVDESASRRGESWMPNTSESPKGGGVCSSLHQILLGGGANPTEILFERHGLSGDPETGEGARKGSADGVDECPADDVAAFREGAFGGYVKDKLAGTCKARGGFYGGGDETLVIEK